ncbi:MAG TPA: glycosyltransferase family 2 protein [Chloroflexia bacterium]|nr:glycosyltransferase family 2 protein [Chloroflexia bacterium]
MPACAVVVVNWDGARHLPGCLSGLAAQTYRDFAVWVVDNGSTDPSCAILARAAAGHWPVQPTPYGPPAPVPLPALHLLRNAGNQGFAAGNNRAFRAALADPTVQYCVPLNNDTVAHPEWLRTLVATAAADSRIGSVASTLLFANHPARVASAGITAHRDGLALDRGVGWAVTTLPATPQPVFGASAGAALYRRALLDDVGLFDAAFHSYLEDADLAWRARLRGWRAVWAPGAQVLHTVSATGGQGSPFKSYHLARNRIWCLAKNLPDALLWRDGPYILRYDLLALLYGLAGRDRAVIRGRLAALQDLPRVRRQRATIQARRTVPPAQIARWLAPALGPRGALAARRAVDTWLSTH